MGKVHEIAAGLYKDKFIEASRQTRELQKQIEQLEAEREWGQKELKSAQRRLSWYEKQEKRRNENLKKGREGRKKK